MIVILDWDGTLVDSPDAITECMRRAAQSVDLVPTLRNSCSVVSQIC